MASFDARKTPLPTLWKPIPIFLCSPVANNEVLRILIKLSFPRRHPYFSLLLCIQVPEQDYTSSAGFLRVFYPKVCLMIVGKTRDRMTVGERHDYLSPRQ